MSSFWPTASKENSDELVAKIRNNYFHFFVGRNVPGNRTGWIGLARYSLTITKVLLPKTIVYSLSDDSVNMNVAYFENEPFGLADRMEILIPLNLLKGNLKTCLDVITILTFNGDQLDRLVF